ncbi:hypothetical protein [Streptosporangium longisporum]|uniref:Uncharacterized protein n=1 Tax=Streptosporangium longisporum TaxID=46187 RepID=A0ABP6KAP1_9ACTN
MFLLNAHASPIAGSFRSALMVDLGFVGPSKPADDYQLLGVTDGDTPTIAMAMVSIDTPESAYGGNPATA